MGPATAFGERRLVVRRFHAVRALLAALLLVAGCGLAPLAAAQQQSGSTYGPVRPADTLWELALRFRGDANVTAQQAMIAILRVNREAFREGNINALRTGVTLRVPTPADMAAITQGEAVAEFNRHEQAWRNRRRTGTAAPAPGPAGTARTAERAPAPAPAEEETSPEDELRAEVAELRNRLAERDEAIEELLVQLAAVRRELRQVQAGSVAPPGGSAERDEEGPAEDAASRATWLPVSPLVLGSSLIVLLVLIVVVTLIRQRGEREDPYPDDLQADDEEEPYELEPDEEAEEALGAEQYEDRGDGEPDAEPSRVRATAALAPVAAAAIDPGADREESDDESTDLPIGMDLEGEDEEWVDDAQDREPFGNLGESTGRDGEAEIERHVEVGELDDLELDVEGPRGSFTEFPADLDDDSPEHLESNRPGDGRRE